jgi:hypothetical protein
MSVASKTQEKKLKREISLAQRIEPGRYTEHIFFMVKHHLVLIEIVKGLFKVIKQIPTLF